MIRCVVNEGARENLYTVYGVCERDMTPITFSTDENIPVLGSV